MDLLGLVLSPEISAALRQGDPVVALESAVITQGLPFPQNLEASRRQAAAIRNQGAVPATVAVLRGRIRVGLSEEEIRQLAQSAPKAAARDLTSLMLRGREGGTTVSGTVAVAGLVGIPLVSTGGIGGVHRAALEGFDISADLLEISRQKVAVVCSGVKSFLDIAATLEALEALGVPVVGLATAELPGFLARVTGMELEHQVDDALLAAHLLRLHWEALKRSGGLLIVQPVPAENAVDPKVLEEATDRAIEQCSSAGIRGKDRTPFLLRRLEKLTAGRSLKANLALLEQNAALAAKIAVALSGRRAETADTEGS